VTTRLTNRAYRPYLLHKLLGGLSRGTGSSRLLRDRVSWNRGVVFRGKGMATTRSRHREQKGATMLAPSMSTLRAASSRIIPYTDLRTGRGIFEGAMRAARKAARLSFGIASRLILPRDLESQAREYAKIVSEIDRQMATSYSHAAYTRNATCLPPGEAIRSWRPVQISLLRIEFPSSR
jgi:hypothetical protein